MRAFLAVRSKALPGLPGTRVPIVEKRMEQEGEEGETEDRLELRSTKPVLSLFVANLSEISFLVLL